MQENNLENTEVFDISKYTDLEQKTAFNKDAKVKIYTLYQICKIIDLGMKRGAFNASEASLIGLFYDTLIKSVKESFDKTVVNTS